MPSSEKIGAVMVVGGGIGGIQAALDLAEAGFKVYLVESAPAIGGRMAQLDKTFPTNDCAICILSPKLVECGRHLNIEVLTNTELIGLKGEPGNFTAMLRRKPRYVDVNKCTACGDCAEACPVSLPSEYNAGLAQRKAIYQRYPQAIPRAFAIDKRGVSPCKAACPIGTSAQGYIALIAEGRFQEALEVSRRVNPFTSVCGRICYHPCEESCNRGKFDQPVAIAALKRFIADYAVQHGEEPVEPVEVTRKEKVAIVGSGPCGLTAAQDLALLGYSVTVFEALPEPGGMLRYGIPPYRLPKDVLARDIKRISDLGVNILTNHPVKDVEVLLHDYDAVFVAVGAHKDIRMGIEGEDLKGVYSAIDLLRRINVGQEVEVGRKVYVVGGGNTAIDAARSCLRLGADATILYRRSRAEMPAHPFEIAAAEEEGVRIQFLTNPTRIMGRDGKVAALECVRMELGAPDETGRRRPIPIPGSEFTLEADSVIFAIGQRPDLSLLPPDIRVSRRGITVDPETMATSREGLFAGGDAVTGPRNAVEAIAAGHRAAEAIHKYLSGEEVEFLPRVDEEKVVELSDEEIEERLANWGVERRGRAKMPTLPLERRLRSFEEVELGLSEEEAILEAKRCLSCAVCSECYACVKACQADAIMQDDMERIEEIPVGSVILAPGYKLYDPSLSEEFGFGRYPNVVTSIQFERLLSASGPTRGRILRPSDGKEPKRIAFIQCVGSRDRDHDYCSSICCMYATKEAILAREHLPGVECSIFMMDVRAFSKGFDDYYRRAQEEGIRYIRSRPYLIEDPLSHDLFLLYEAEDNKLREEKFDLVVLSVGLEAPEKAHELAQALGIALDSQGFCRTEPFKPLETSRPGVYVCGAFSGPKDIPETVVEASGAAAKAMALLAEARGTLVERKEYPPEIDVTGQEPRIGVFICHCGNNIAGVVDVAQVVEYAKMLPNVAYAGDNLYTCSQDAQEIIKEKIIEHSLNRVVVASCTPRTHEPLFQETMREVGLNPYLFEMANIRDQCSWVHSDEPELATEKAKALVRMAVARARRLEPLRRVALDLDRHALVIGGGAAGMNAALALAEQGFPVYLIERERELGGYLRHIHYTLDGLDPQAYLRDLIARVESHPLITVFKETKLVETKGFVGNFVSRLSKNGEEREVRHGAVIVATGAEEWRGNAYLLGEDPRVMTQTEFEEILAEGRLDAKALRRLDAIVMIQCVGPWDAGEDVPFYCSRICCTVAIKNALKVKELNPEADVYILYKDVRTYGFWERYYTLAREKGVVFIRYTDEDKPAVRQVDGRLEVRVHEPILDREIVLSPDLLVLSTSVVPAEGSEELSELLKLPLTREGFFLEAHVKLRPVDFASDGIFLCGLAHYPKFLEESIAQAHAVAARAATILAKEKLLVGGPVAVVDESKCTGCLTCVRVCPYGVPQINPEKVGVGGIHGVAEIEIARCQGCGTCAAECPAKAIQLLHFRDDQILAKEEALFAEVFAS